MEDQSETYRQLIVRATHAAGGELNEFQPNLTLGDCGIDTGIRLSAFFSNLCEGLVKAIPGFRPRAYAATFDNVSGGDSLESLLNLIREVEVRPEGPPKPQPAAAAAQAAEPSPPASESAPQGLFSKFKKLFPK